MDLDDAEYTDVYIPLKPLKPLYIYFNPTD